MNILKNKTSSCSDCDSTYDDLIYIYTNNSYIKDLFSTNHNDNYMKLNLKYYYILML